MKLSIIIPCYNEAASLPLLIKRLGESAARPDVEIILVNNGSKDNTKEVLAQYTGAQRFFRVVDVAVNRGYGFGILSGLKEGRGDFLGWTHADLQTDPADISRAVEVIEQQGASPELYIKGSRRGRSMMDNFFTCGMSLFESILLQEKLWDINAQPNIFHKSFYAGWKNSPHDFSLDLYAFYLARRQKLNIVRLPVDFPPRLHGVSNWNTGLKAKGKFIKRTVDFSFQLKKELSR